VAAWLIVAGCGLGPPGAADAPEAPPPAAPSLPDVSDAEVFRGAPAAAGSRGQTGTDGRDRSRVGATLGGGAGIHGTGASTPLGEPGPCRPPALKIPDVTVTENAAPNLEERMFGTTSATAVVTDPDPCPPGTSRR
jgi:hypothetical protein